MRVELPPILMTSVDRAWLELLVEENLEHGAAVEFLAREVARAETVEPHGVGPGVATMHSILEYRDDMTGQVRQTMLVYPGQENSLAGSISVLSAEGTALIGLTEGQRIQWRTEAGKWCRLTLQKVLSQPEQVASWQELGRHIRREAH